jgi:3-deoxy-D-manno-octulosonic-acid transferase
MYFINFSKMVNRALLEIDGKTPDGLRDQLNFVQLHALSVAETVIARTLVECMTKHLPYKEIYQIAKTKIETYAMVVGRTRPGISARAAVGLVA